MPTPKSTPTKAYYHIDLGEMPYKEARLVQALAQKAVLRSSSDGGIGGIILTCQHPPVITFGKNSALEHLTTSPGELDQAGITLVNTDRGGEVTGHNPGQLVAYPILHLPDLKMMAKAYIHALEQVVIDLLRNYDIDGTRDQQHPGIWVGEQKICAVGVRFSRRVSLHGLALNITNDLSLFDRMTPCGITGRGVTSILDQQRCQSLGIKIKPNDGKASVPTTVPSVQKATEQFLTAFATVFDIVPVCLPLTSLLDRRIPS